MRSSISTRSPLAYAAFVLVGPPAEPEAQERVATAQMGVVQSTVSGSGNLEPATPGSERAMW
jgi:hypothetical protein